MYMVEDNTVYRQGFICVGFCLPVEVRLIQDTCLSTLDDFKMILERRNEKLLAGAVGFVDVT